MESVITERKQAEKDIRKLNQDLAKRIRMHTAKLEKKIRDRNMMAIFDRNPK